MRLIRRLDLLAGVEMEDLPGAAQGSRNVHFDQIGAGLQIFAHGAADLLDTAKEVSHKSMAVRCTDAAGGHQQSWSEEGSRRRCLAAGNIEKTLVSQAVGSGHTGPMDACGKKFFI